MSGRSAAEREDGYGSVEVWKWTRADLPHRHTSILLLFVFVVVFARYATMAAPGLLWGDAGEFQLAAWTAGLAHPTGYPLFLLLGWGWTHALAPLVPPTRAMTLLSSLFGALTVAVFALLLLTTLRRTTSDHRQNEHPSDTNTFSPRLLVPLSPHHLVALASALWFAVTPAFWREALIPEVYTLNALFVVTLLWLLLRMSRRTPDPADGVNTQYGIRNTQYTYAVAFVYGLSLTHHRTMLLWLPALLAYVTLEWPAWWRDARRLLIMGALVALPQLLYLYVPLRGPVTPYLHQRLGNGEVLSLYDGSWQAFLAHVSGTVFQEEIGLQVSLAERLSFFAGLWIENVTWVGVVAGLVGLLWLLRRRDWPLLALTGLGFTGIVVFGLVYAIGDVEVMFIPAWLVWILWSVIGVYALGLQIRRLQVESSTLNLQPSNLLPIAVLMGFVAFQYVAWADDLDRSGSRSARDRWEEILAAGPPRDAFLVSNDRNEMVPLWYIQFVEGRRRDLFGIFPLITQRPEHANVVRVTERVMPYGRPTVFIKSMPGLETKFDLRRMQAPLVAVTGAADVPEQAPLAGDVAPELRISGWAASDARIGAGTATTVTLAWEPEAPLQHDYTTFVHLFDANGEPVTQNDHRPGGVYYPSSLWRVGERIRDRHVLQLPEVLPDSAVEVRAGAYRHVGDEIQPLGRAVQVGWLLPADAPFAPADADAPLTATFGDALALQGAEVPVRVTPGDPLDVTLQWTVLDAPPEVTLFVHLVPEGAPGPPVAQYDGRALPGYPTSSWPAGTQTQSTVSMTLPADAPPGEYDLLVGFYDPNTGRRLITDDGGDGGVVATVTVVR